MTKVTKKQIRRTPFGSCYMVLYVKHRFDPENDSCILLSEDGTLKKELTKVVGTWTLICNPDTEPHKCDLFLEDTLGNIGIDEKAYTNKNDGIHEMDCDEVFDMLSVGKPYKWSSGYGKDDDSFIEWLNNLTDEEMIIIRSIPNFSDKLFKMTGTRVED